MTEKSETVEAVRLRLELMLLDTLEAAEAADDGKSQSKVEGKFRMVTAGVRACNSIAASTGSEDNMSADGKDGEEARMARTNELRAEIERRLARIRAAAENKAVAGKTGPRKD